jgi:hypothetical protein
MCYESLYWRYAAGRMKKQEEPKPVSERTPPPATQAIEPLPVAQKNKTQPAAAELETT